MYQNPKRSFRKSDDNKHHLFQILSQIKESISKRRFNHAYEMGFKYYEQNKTILTNEEIYQLSWNCCTAIQNKLYHRLTIKNKKNYVPPVTQQHVKHLFSLQMSLHSIVLPEIARLNEKYFNMLGVENEGINPKDISGQYISFQRKSRDQFLDKSKATKQVKRLVKQHLKICNAVLMYKLNHLKNKSQIREIFKTMEQIYQHFEEHDFPSENMDYLLIKLSFIEVQGSNQHIPCTYKLPLGYLAKLYQKIRKNRQNGIQHYLNKLSSFFVLGFRNLLISIQDMFILSSQLQYITKILSDRYDEVSAKNFITKKKQGLNVKRQVTIDKQPFQDSFHRLSKREESISTYNKLSQKKMESKRNIRSSEKSLRMLVQSAINHIEYSMNCRKQVIEIVLKYFTLSYLQKSRSRDTEQILSGQVILLNANSRSIKKKNIYKDNYQNGSSIQKGGRKNFKSLTSVLRDIRIQKKSSSLEQGNQDQKVRFHTTLKERGKFITRNVDLISRHSELKIGYFTSVSNLLKSVQNYQNNMVIEKPNLNKQQILQDFQLDRLEKIKSFKDKLKVKSIKLQNNMGEIKQEALQLSTLKQKQQKKINLLNDVVENNIIKHLQLPFNDITLKNRSYSSPIFKKLQTLKSETQNLKSQRNYLVQKLKVRRVMCLTQPNTQIDYNQVKLTQKQFKIKKENQQQINKFSQHFAHKIDKYIQSNKKLMRIEKNTTSPFKIKVLNKPKIKLKLDRPNKKLPEITFQNLQQQYNKLEGKLQKDKIEWELTLSSQFDKLRRDAAKNQFLNQNQRKHKNQNVKPLNNTIHQIALDDQQQNFY